MALHAGDLTDHAAVLRAGADLSPDEVYNLAGQSSVARSWEEPELSWAVNATAAVALLTAVADLPGEPRFVQASSAEIFGRARPEPAGRGHAAPPRATRTAPRRRYAHLAAGVSAPTGCTPALILYNHESPRRPTRS